MVIVCGWFDSDCVWMVRWRSYVDGRWRLCVNALIAIVCEWCDGDCVWMTLHGTANLHGVRFARSGLPVGNN